MKQAWCVGAAVGLMLTLACSDDGGPSGPIEPSIEFQVTAPSSVGSKAQIDILVRIIQAVNVTYPLTVIFEKANAGEGFNIESRNPLFTPEMDRVTVSSPAGRDPRYRVTVVESGPREFSVSRTISVDVIDFP